MTDEMRDLLAEIVEGLEYEANGGSGWARDALPKLRAVLAAPTVPPGASSGAPLSAEVRALAEEVLRLDGEAQGPLSFEPHGAGLAVYAGRDLRHHGLRLFNITDGDKDTYRMLSALCAYRTAAPALARAVLTAPAAEPVPNKVLTQALADVTYPGYRFRTGPMGDGYFLQVVYDEECIETGKMAEQRGRKWYVSAHATRSEVVQTALKAVLTSAEHRVREHFVYKGRRVFGPHYDVERLVELCDGNATEKRAHMPAAEPVPPLDYLSDEAATQQLRDRGPAFKSEMAALDPAPAPGVFDIERLHQMAQQQMSQPLGQVYNVTPVGAPCARCERLTDERDAARADARANSDEADRALIAQGRAEQERDDLARQLAALQAADFRDELPSNEQCQAHLAREADPNRRGWWLLERKGQIVAVQVAYSDQTIEAELERLDFSRNKWRSLPLLGGLPAPWP